jgi:Capsular polysaccharide synthesis protein
MPENGGKTRNPADVRAFRRAKNMRLKAEMFGYLRALGPEDEIAALVRDCGNSAREVPRRIWMYWHDGWDKAPEICHLCAQSWRQRNPGYEVHALDLEALKTVLDDPPKQKDMSFVRGYANRVRLRLLRTHGGVWADATNFCLGPVDPWIHERTAPAGLFAYTLPNAERLIATWFLAAVPRSALMAAWEHLITRYFEAVERDGRDVHGYFFMPYTFEYAMSSHPELAALWARMPKVPVGDTGRVALAANLGDEEGTRPLGEPKRAVIRELLAATPMQKLTWKGQVRAGTEAARQVLDMLKENLQAETGASPGQPDC